MTKINVGRMLLGGIVAGILLFLADGFIHEKLLKDDWMAMMRAAGRSVEGEEHGGDMAYFAVFELLRGLAIAWLYAVIRAHYGPGPKTAICAALTVWGLMFPLAFLQLVPIGIFSMNMLTMWSLYELITSVVAGLVAGALYKDAAAA
jgi:hypothetical protein